MMQDELTRGNDTEAVADGENQTQPGEVTPAEAEAQPEAVTQPEAESAEEALHRLAKARSTLNTKTAFRFIACAYLVYEGSSRLIRGYLDNPAEFPFAAFLFGIFFIVIACVYAVYGLLTYRKQSRLLRMEEEATAQQNKKEEAQ